LPYNLLERAHIDPTALPAEFRSADASSAFLDGHFTQPRRERLEDADRAREAFELDLVFVALVLATVD